MRPSSDNLCSLGTGVVSQHSSAPSSKSLSNTITPPGRFGDIGLPVVALTVFLVVGLPQRTVVVAIIVPILRRRPFVMAYDYAFVHLKFTIPLAVILTLVQRPLLTNLDWYKTASLIVIAFTATLPWDSYLIHRGVWNYPEGAIIGPKLFRVPIEELFFFVIQTYITSLLYIFLNRPVLHAQYLTNAQHASPRVRWARSLGQAVLVGCTAVGALLVKQGGGGTYLGLILAWASPFALLTWSFSGYFLAQLPSVCIAVPIVLPTLYLWVVDELALGRGTWAIGSGTKLGWCLWGHLEVEEAVFFLFTNTLIVFGLVAFDRGMAVLTFFPDLFPEIPTTLPSPRRLVDAVLTDPAKYDMERVRGIREAIATLREKSRSFYLASSVFPARLRVDLIFLYSFCRVADDLVDDAETIEHAQQSINDINIYLEKRYKSPDVRYGQDRELRKSIERSFPISIQSAFKLLPSALLPQKPLLDLLEGFKMDLQFGSTAAESGAEQKLPSGFPIQGEVDLQLYASRVASTVGELCLWLVFHHSVNMSPAPLSNIDKAKLVQAARMMGHALQYVNIARDIAVDAAMGRVYLPTTWLKEENTTPRDLLVLPQQDVVERLRTRLLDLAFAEYSKARPVMDLLPVDIRGPLVVAVESYMEIGRVLRERRRGRGLKDAQQGKGRLRRATVPRWRRLMVAWRVLAEERARR